MVLSPKSAILGLPMMRKLTEYKAIITRIDANKGNIFQ